MTTANTELIEAWARHRPARDHLRDLLLQLRGGSLDALRAAMGKRYRREGTPERLCDHHVFGKHGRVPVKHELTRTWMGLRIPAAEKREPAIVVQFSNYFKVPHFTVQAQPFDAEELLREKHPGFVAASRKLQQCGFDSNGRYWAHVRSPQEWLYADDVPQTLAGFVGADIRNIVESGLFDEAVAAGV